MRTLLTSVSVFMSLAVATWAATPPSGTVSEAATPIWTGPFKPATQSAECSGPNDPACDNFLLTIVPPPPEYGPYAVEIILQPMGDWDLQVYDSNNIVVGDSGEAPSVAESVTLNNPPAGTYTVAAAAFAPLPGPDADGDSTLDSYTARAFMKPGTAVNPPGSEYITYANFVPPGTLGRGAAEPSIGANWVSGRALFQAGPETLRVTWDDCSSPPDADWQDVAFVTTTGPSLDPILFTDPVTGRTIVSQLSANCSTAALTDDDGVNWLPSQGCGLNSGVDHQSIGSGPYHDPIPTPPPPAYPHPVYYCAQENATSLCARSDDGGLTFGPAVPMYNLAQCGGLHGEPNVAPDGTVYVPNKGCTGRQAVIVSEDNGLTWSIRRIPNTSGGDWDPDIGIGSDGTLYVGMTDGGHPTVAVSTDRGLTWSFPIDVGVAFDIDNTSFPAVVAGDGDRAAFAFLGIDADQGGGGGDDPSWPGGDAATRPAWHMYVAHTYDRGQTWTTINVTPNDPVQRGTIYAGGFTVEGALTRNLLDFNRAAVDKFGRVLIGWADGCIDNCVTGTTNSNAELGTVSRQVGGKRLFAQYDNLDVPAAPSVSAKTSVGPPQENIITWQEPDDRGSRITEYKVYRRTPTTDREVIATLGAGARSHRDEDLVAGQTYFYSVTASNDLGEGPFCLEVVPDDAPPPVDPCDYPGVTLLTDAAGDASTTQPAHDVLSLSVTEPYSLGAGRIMFVLNMASLASLPPDTYWPVQFNVGATTYTARMTTFPPATPEAPGFEYYEGAWNELVPVVSAADPASIFFADGTIRIVVPRSGVGDPPVGSDLTSFLVRIAVNAGGVLLTPDNMPESAVPAGSYRTVGSENCLDDGGCSNPLFAGAESVSSPPEETCTLELAWSSATTSCPPPRYNIYRSTSSTFIPSLDNLIALGADGLSYRDQAGLEAGTTYYYIVRAEDSQTSYDGPANHGKEEDNLVRLGGTPSGPPAPAPDFSDDFEPSSEPGWTVDTAENANAASPEWAVTADPFAQSPGNSFFSAAGLDPKDDRLIAPPQYLSSGSHLTFWHRYSFEPGYDGGVLEVSTDGATWVDAIAGGGVFIQGGYTDTINTGFGSAIAGRSAWSGDSEFADAMTEVEIDLGAFAGPGVLLRWRLALDTFGAGATPGAGWWVDDVALTGLLEAGACTTQTCGDGIVDAGEECDEGGLNSDTQADACRTDCTAAACGDGVIDSSEGCDDGADNSDTVANACRTDCQAAGCGDGVVDSGELCDDGAANSDTEADACRTHCLPASCGDGTLDTDEACDDGLANSDTEADACRTYCLPAGCGDGFADSGEECDDGDSNSNTEPDACRMDCAAAHCGDSVVDSSENCDDGNGSAGDGCSAVCQVEMAPPAAEPGGANKNRFISFMLDPIAEGSNVAIRVRLVTVHDTSFPANAPDLSAFEGQVRYLNTFRDQQGEPVLSCRDSGTYGTSFKCAKLGCQPEYRDWGADADGQVLHVTGSAVVPSSIYAVAVLPSGCTGSEASCALASGELSIGTPQWGNVNNDAAVNAMDIAAVVDKVKDLPSAIKEPRAMLQPQEPAPGSFAVNAMDIAAVVDAVKGYRYPFGIASCP